MGRTSLLLLAGAALLSCDSDGAEAPASQPGWDAGAGGSGGQSTTTPDAGGSGAGGDLGWPRDTSLPTPCPDDPVDLSGTSWQGWANYQHPDTLLAVAGDGAGPVYGRVYQAQDTPGSGQASGWQAELFMGPYGTLPTTSQGRCWSQITASYNVDVGNDDEYQASVTPTEAGLYGLLFRYRPAGGEWRFGDLDGSDNGLEPSQAGLLVAQRTDSSPRPLIVASLNLRCRLDGWPARLPLVVQALARVNPDLVAFQEDCIPDQDTVSQAELISPLLSGYTGRGYDTRREGTHQATAGTEIFDEGISLLSAHPIEQEHVVALPHAHFPRKALGIDVTIRGEPIRFFTTHFDFGADASAERTASAEAVIAALPTDRIAVVAGDLNSYPNSDAVAVLSSSLMDLWQTANPGDLGLTFPATAPEHRIDYIFASPSLATTLAGGILLDEQAGGVLLSDHLGVAALLSAPSP